MPTYVVADDDADAIDYEEMKMTPFQRARQDGAVYLNLCLDLLDLLRCQSGAITSSSDNIIQLTCVCVCIYLHSE